MSAAYLSTGRTGGHECLARFEVAVAVLVADEATAAGRTFEHRQGIGPSRLGSAWRAPVAGGPQVRDALPRLVVDDAIPFSHRAVAQSTAVEGRGEDAPDGVEAEPEAPCHLPIRQPGRGELVRPDGRPDPLGVDLDDLGVPGPAEAERRMATRVAVRLALGRIPGPDVAALLPGVDLGRLALVDEALPVGGITGEDPVVADVHDDAVAMEPTPVGEREGEVAHVADGVADEEDVERACFGGGEHCPELGCPAGRRVVHRIGTRPARTPDGPGEPGVREPELPDGGVLHPSLRGRSPAIELTRRALADPAGRPAAAQLGRVSREAWQAGGVEGAHEAIGSRSRRVRVQEFEPGVAADRGRAPARPRVPDDRPGPASPATGRERDDRCVSPRCLEIGEHDCPGLSGESGLAGLRSADAGEVVGARGGLHHEQDVPARPRAKGRLVAGELVADLGGVLGRLVDLEAQDTGATVELEGDDAVGVDVGQVGVGHDRFREPCLDGMAIGRFDRESGEGGDGLDDVERMTELGACPGAGERTIAETTTCTGGEAEGEGRTTASVGWQDRSFEPACAIERGEVFLGCLATVVDEGHELARGGDDGAVEDAQSSSIAGTQEACIEAHPTVGSRSRPERPDHCMGSRR